MACQFVLFWWHTTWQHNRLFVRLLGGGWDHAVALVLRGNGRKHTRGRVREEDGMGDVNKVEPQERKSNPQHVTETVM